MGEASKEREASTAKRVEVACILRITSCAFGLATRRWRGGSVVRIEESVMCAAKTRSTRESCLRVDERTGGSVIAGESDVK
jgi:hypothetical protein